MAKVKKFKRNYRKNSRRKTRFQLTEFAYMLGLIQRGLKNPEGSQVRDAYERGLEVRELKKKKTIL